MNALYTWLTLRGQGFSDWLDAWAGALRFAMTALVGMLSPATYNRATRRVVQKQIYFSAWQILPGFTVFAVLERIRKRIDLVYQSAPGTTR